MTTPPSQAPQWPDEIYEQISRGVGTACFGLLFSEPRWVHRRVETIDVLSRELAHSSTSVDFTVPQGFRDLLALPNGQEWLVPVAVLPKLPLRNFDMRDERRVALPIVGRTQNGEIAFQALLAGSMLARDSEEVWSPQLQGALRELVLSDPDAEESPEVRLRVLVEDEAEVDEFLGDQRTRFLLNEVTENYVVLTVVHDVERRRVLKYSYEFELGQAYAPSPKEKLGWEALPLEFAVPAAGRAASYHAEVVVPEELRISWALIYDPRTRALFDLSFDTDRASLYTPEVRLPQKPVLAFGVTPERAGFPTVSLVVAWVTAVLLSLGATFGELHAERAGPAISLLLAGSALFAGVVARVGEHRLSQAQFRWPRSVLIGNALAGLASAAALAFGLCDGLVQGVWMVGAIVGAATACILTVSFAKAAPTLK